MWSGGKERPPRPELVKRTAALPGGSSHLLFRLAESTDPGLAEYIHLVSNVPEFLRTAREMKLTSEDFRREPLRESRPNATRLRGRDNGFRLRTGDWRVICFLDNGGS